MGRTGAARARVESYGLRPTRSRQAVLTVLERERGRQLTPQALHREARSIRPGLGLATVYRTLSALENEGLVEVVTQDGAEAAYRLCSPGHHHHLVCTGCGAVIEILQCDLSSMEQTLGRRYHFQIEEHAITFRGRCETCA